MKFFLISICFIMSVDSFANYKCNSEIYFPDGSFIFNEFILFTPSKLRYDWDSDGFLISVHNKDNRNFEVTIYDKNQLLMQSQILTDVPISYKKNDLEYLLVCEEE